MHFYVSRGNLCVRSSKTSNIGVSKANMFILFFKNVLLASSMTILKSVSILMKHICTKCYVKYFKGIYGLFRTIQPSRVPLVVTSIVNVYKINVHVTDALQPETNMIIMA